MDIFELLGFDEVLCKVQAFTKSELARENALLIKPFSSVEEARHELTLLDEASSILVRFGSLPLTQSHNLALILESARSGNNLTLHDFYLISADILNLLSLKSFLSDKLDRAPLLKELLTKQVDLHVLDVEINKVITPNLTIKDNATHELARIRKNIRLSEDRLAKLANSLLSKYSSILAEEVLTKRDGHFVIPIKTVHKNKINGIIYDISNSGQTIFIEPSEIATLNNTLVSYQNDEIVEINRILRSLTSEVLNYETAIINNNILLSTIDLIFAKGEYGLKINGFIPHFIDEVGLNFVDARHPLLKVDTLVANSFHINKDRFIIIISGPNAGGKTVALKTMGLFVLMAKSGLMLPVSQEPSLFFFENVYATIGDEQSLTANLSTFSSHAQRIGEILHVATNKDFVLLDELGTGTSPEEGEALALAVTSHLQRNHISAVISSHYSRLKQFAFDHPGIINASMAFDETKLAPLYAFHENVPGRSYGLVVAKRFGIPAAIIKEAESLLNEGVYDFEMTIGRLRAEIHTNEKLKVDLEQATRELSKKEQAVTKELSRLKEELEIFRLEKNKILKAEVETTLEKLDLLVKEALTSGGKAHEIIALRREIQETTNEQAEEEEIDNVAIENGDFVEIKSLLVSGEVVKINNDQLSVKLSSGKILKVNITDVTKTKRPSKKVVTPVVKTEYKNEQTVIRPEINLIGLRVDEALSVLEAYLDKALLKHYSKVTIIHGYGSGALRRAVHEYLKTLPYVKSFALGGQFEGQGGATVVSL